MSDRSWVLFGALVLGLKALFLALDPVPKFFFGDSSCYMHTAVDGWIPPDRSFAYGFLIRLVALPTGSLMPLLGLQVVAGGASAILLAHILRRCFCVPTSVAQGLSLACALEPIQLLYERFVMAETLALFLFVLQLAAALRYLEARSLRILALVSLVGVAMVSLRTSYLPWVLAASVLIPLLGSWTGEARGGGGMRHFEGRWGARTRGFRRLRWVGHLALSVGLTWALHSGYKQLFGALSEYPTGYHAAGGYFLLAAWAPVVDPQDFPDPDIRDRIYQKLAFDLKDRWTREDHLFSKGGLSNAVQATLPWAEGDRLASTAAMNALKRDPVGVLKLSWLAYLDYFDLKTLPARIANDLSLDQARPYEEFYGVFSEYFRLPGEGVQPMTLTKRYYQAAVPWYWLLLLSPVIAAAGLFRRRGSQRVSALVLLLAVCTTLAAICGLGVTPVVRYLHPLAWLTLCCLGVLWPATPPDPRPKGPFVATQDPASARSR